MQKEQNNWRWQVKNSIRTCAELEKYMTLTADEKAAFNRSVNQRLPFAITPYYVKLLSGTLRKSVVPTVAEFDVAPEESDDPLDEKAHNPVPHLIHRYHNRVLLLVTSCCAVYCRYCTRARLVGKMAAVQLEQALSYIEQHTQIEDVLISGGDPLMLPDAQLERILQRLHAIPHLKFIRIGTKVPVVLPQRITPALVRMLKKYPPLLMSLHVTHPDELTPEMRKACARLVDAGIVLGSQTVLLKGINDNVPTLRALMMRLLSCRVRPYYLFGCDRIKGSAHLYVPDAVGACLVKELRAQVSGYAVPHYVADGKNGKQPIFYR